MSSERLRSSLTALGRLCLTSIRRLLSRPSYEDAPTEVDEHLPETLAPVRRSEGSPSKPVSGTPLLAPPDPEVTPTLPSRSQPHPTPGKRLRTGQPELPGFEMMKELGRGGMGVVYLARQHRPERLVAIKMLPGGAMVGDRARQRFYREADALARLSHPNIVPVYEVGEMEDQPYLVMEYVPGGSLAGRLTGAVWAPEEAAEIVAVLADAAHAAHVAGLVHRDLKPANVLVVLEFGTETGKDRLIPKITDFGIAKRLDLEASETLAGEVLGTPNYMAPEQAMRRGPAVGPAADLHALGALLYELLTGRPPYLGVSVADTLQQLLSDPPLPPSRLVPRLRRARDLETICLKCLEKDPLRRYASAADLAADLRRFVAGEPIRARRTLPWVRAWKWARRRPAAAALIAVLTVVGLTLSVGGPYYAHTQRQRAEAEAHLRRQYEHALGELEGVDDDLMRLFRAGLSDMPHLEGMREELLGRAVRVRHFLVEAQGPDPAQRRTLGRAHLRVADLQHLLGRIAEAEEAYEAARVLFADLAAEAEASTDAIRHLAESYDGLGNCLLARGDPAGAKEAYQQAAQQRVACIVSPRAGDDERHALALSHRHLGLALVALGEEPQARQEFAAAILSLEGLPHTGLAGIDRRFDLVLAHNDLANAQRDTDPTAAEASYQRARVVLEELMSLAGSRPAFRQHLAAIHNNLGLLRAAVGKHAEAEESFTRSLKEKSDLARDFPRLSVYNRAWIIGLNNECARLLGQGQYARAAALMRQAREQATRLIGEFAEIPDYLHELARAESHRATLALAENRHKEAEEAWTEAAQRSQSLVNRHPDVPHYAQELARTRRQLGLLLSRLGRPAQARTSLESAVVTGEDLVQRFARTPDWQYELALSLDALGDYLAAQGDDSAESPYRKSLDLLGVLVTSSPRTPAYAQAQALVQNHLALWLLARPDRSRDAEELLRTALTIQRGLVAQHSHVLAYRQDQAATHNHLAICLSGRLPAAAVDEFQQSIDLQESFVKEHPNDRAIRETLIVTLENLAGLQKGLGNPEAEKVHRERAAQLRR